MQHSKINTSLLVAMLIVVVLSCLHSYIAPFVGEETRYASVAWRMFVEHNWFIPQHGGAAYLHKTPLLFWCLNLGWWININWPWQVIIPVIFALLTLYYTQKLACVLFPNKPMIFSLTPLILLAMPFFINNLGILRFDMMLTLFNVMACYHLMRMRSSRGHYWAFVLANGLGLLAKGPVIYMFTLPEVLLFCIYFSYQPWQDAQKLLMGIVLSAGALLVWWGPIIYQGKLHLIDRMLFEQVVARATGSKGVVKPFWDYVPLLPCFFLPWILFAPFLQVRTIFGENEQDRRAARFLIQLFIICFILFSLLKTKESRYLLPVIPLVAIFIAYHLEKMMLTFFRQRYFISTYLVGTALCLSAIAFFVLLNYFPHKVHIFYAHYFPNSVDYVLFFIGFLVILGARLSLKAQVTLFIWMSIGVAAAIDLGTTYAIAKTQDVMPAVKFIDGLFAKNLPVVSRDRDVWDMQFLGRWPVWIPVVKQQQKFNAWAHDHPQGWVIMPIRNKKGLQEAYVTMVNGCFEQSYDHLRSVLQICPVSRLVMVSQNEINVAEVNENTGALTKDKYGVTTIYSVNK